ncbi:MAG: hypothetical protein GEU73_05180 [Chloroflexi bacterium]|nr:hypothetical protein [Chloroflexota bacterium]
MAQLRMKYSARKIRVEANAFEIVIATLCLLSSLVYLVGPEAQRDPAIVRLLGDFIWVWAGALVVAGLSIIGGLWFGSPRWEIAGLLLLSSAAALQALAFMAFIGFAASVPMGLFVSIAWASLVRVRLVLMHRVL